MKWSSKLGLAFRLDQAAQKTLVMSKKHRQIAMRSRPVIRRHILLFSPATRKNRVGSLSATQLKVDLDRRQITIDKESAKVLLFGAPLGHPLFVFRHERQSVWFASPAESFCRFSGPMKVPIDNILAL